MNERGLKPQRAAVPEDAWVKWERFVLRRRIEKVMSERLFAEIFGTEMSPDD